ncbi:MAG TPA: hypothetical protein VH165_29005 [Kofleriaceae bacterium]|nr:hypothetical protein [Kofleriaceae bacterium]
MTRLGRWWFAPAPAERLAALRIATGGFAAIWMIARLPEVVAVARLPARELDPVGVVRVLGAPLPVVAVVAIAVAAIGCLIAMTAGWRYRATAPAAALGMLWTLSYRNAWGMVFHTDNLLVLHVLALACAPAADAWAVRRSPRPRRPRGPARPEASPPPSAPVVASEPAPPAATGRTRAAAGYGWAIKLLAALTCATYLLAGIAKLRLAGLGWAGGEQLRNQIAVDNLRKALLGGSTAPFARLFVAHPRVLAMFAIATLGVELGAPLGMLGGRVARLWAWAAWSFHVGVVLTMNVWFPYPLVGVAFFPLIHAERVIGGLVARPRQWWHSRNAARPAPGTKPTTRGGVPGCEADRGPAKQVRRD